MFQSYLDKSTPYTPYRWVGTATLLLLFFLRIFIAQGWYIGTHLQPPWLPTNKQSPLHTFRSCRHPANPPQWRTHSASTS